MTHPNITAKSGNVAGSTTFFTGPGKVFSVTMQSSAIGQTRITLKDGVDSGGVEIHRFLRVATAAAGDITDHFEFPSGLHFSVGCFVERGQADQVFSVSYQKD